MMPSAFSFPSSPGALPLHPAIQAILMRRSVREGYTGRQIPLPTLEQIVRCGLAAPSSKNAQPWRLHVAHSPALLAEIADAVLSCEGAARYVPNDPVSGEPWPHLSSSVAASADVLRASAAGIFVENRGLFSRGRQTLAAVSKAHLEGSLVGYTFEIVGIGAAVENMWVAATALGIQGAFLGDVVIAEEAIRERLSLAGDLVGVLTLGYAETGAHPGEVKENQRRSQAVWH